MNIQRWIARREPHWKQLDRILTQIEKKGVKSISAGEIHELASLYRSVSGDLARAKTYQVGKALTQDLQQLTLRSYSQIYQGRRRQVWSQAFKFYRYQFPAIVRQTWVYTAFATGIFMASAAIAWWYSWQDPTFLALVVPEELIHKVRDEHELWMGSILGVEPLAASNIMTNNISVAFKLVAGGIMAGLLTVFLLFFNGLSIGAIAALVGQNNLAYPFWAFVLPHGALELPAIFLAGGAGLLIARALILPGRYRRSDALKYYGGQATQLVYGIVLMLIIAGIIEGFFSPNPLFPETLKYLAGSLLLAALILYCSQSSPPPEGQNLSPIQRADWER